MNLYRFGIRTRLRRLFRAIWPTDATVEAMNPHPDWDDPTIAAEYRPWDVDPEVCYRLRFEQQNRIAKKHLGESQRNREIADAAIAEMHRLREQHQKERKVSI